MEFSEIKNRIQLKKETLNNCIALISQYFQLKRRNSADMVHWCLCSLLHIWPSKQNRDVTSLILPDDHNTTWPRRTTTTHYHDRNRDDKQRRPWQTKCDHQRHHEWNRGIPRSEQRRTDFTIRTRTQTLTPAT